MDSLSLSALDVSQLAIIGVAVFASAFVSGVAGFGGSFILAAALTPLLGPKGVVPLIAVYALIANLGRIYIFRKDIHWPFAVQFTLASLPGLIPGAAFLKWVPEDALLAVFGLVLLLAIPARRALQRARFAPGWRTTFLIGFSFGAISGTAVGSGMFVIAALNTFGLHGPALLGTDAVIGIFNAASRVIAFWWLGLLDLQLAIAGLLTGAVSLPATWLASRVVLRMGRKVHTVIIEAIIVLAGASFLIAALRAAL